MVLLVEVEQTGASSQFYDKFSELCCLSYPPGPCADYYQIHGKYSGNNDGNMSNISLGGQSRVYSALSGITPTIEMLSSDRLGMLLFHDLLFVMLTTLKG